MFTHFDRSVFLTGVLSPPVLVNSSNPVKTTEYTVQMNQDINIDNLYMQGGPGKSVADFQKKIIKGSMTFFPRLSESNTLETAVIDLINASQDYTSSFTLTTFLNPYNSDLTANGTPYIYTTNSFVFDVCVAEKLTLRAKKEGSVEITVDVIGQTDFDNTTPLVMPADDLNIYRNLSWYDCLFTRSGSQLENAYEIEISIIKEIDQRYFIMSYCTMDPNNPVGIDRPYSTGVKSVSVSFKIKEYITSVFDIFNYSFGGFIEGFNFNGNIGPIQFAIPDAVLKISSQNLTPTVIERTTEGFFRMAPNTPDNPSMLFTI
jgi:hypothetical protein